MNHRRARIAGDIRARLAEIINEKVRDPRLSGVSILEVRPAPDMSYARVFFRTLGERAAAEEGLAKAAPFLRRCLADALDLRRVPELDFRFDESPERAARVEGILAEVAAHAAGAKSEDLE